MTLGHIQLLMIKHLGEYTNDAEDPNVLQQYLPEGLHYINEAYTLAMKRYAPGSYFDLLKDDGDEPLFEPAVYHGILADYAAARILLSEPGRTEKAAQLMNQWKEGLAHVNKPHLHFHHRWD